MAEAGLIAFLTGIVCVVATAIILVKDSHNTAKLQKKFSVLVAKDIRKGCCPILLDAEEKCDYCNLENMIACWAVVTSIDPHWIRVSLEVLQENDGDWQESLGA